MTLYPIIRRQRRPLVEVAPAPVAAAVKGTNEQVQETEKAQGLPVAAVAQTIVASPAPKAGEARSSREKKTNTISAPDDSSSSEAAGD